MRLHKAIKRTISDKVRLFPQKTEDGSIIIEDPLRIEIEEDYYWTYFSILIRPKVHITKDGDVLYSGMNVYYDISRFDIGWQDIREQGVKA